MDDLKLYAKNEQQLDSLVQKIRTFSENIGIQFVIDKCALLIHFLYKSLKLNPTQCTQYNISSIAKKDTETPSSGQWRI